MAGIKLRNETQCDGLELPPGRQGWEQDPEFSGNQRNRGRMKPLFVHIKILPEHTRLIRLEKFPGTLKLVEIRLFYHFFSHAIKGKRKQKP
jgi:hypothetical protein